MHLLKVHDLTESVKKVRLARLVELLRLSKVVNNRIIIKLFLFHQFVYKQNASDGLPSLGYHNTK